jgi:hypothetical protein
MKSPVRNGWILSGLLVAVWIFWHPAMRIFYPGLTLADRGQLGDSFGALNALFSGLAFGAVIVTLMYQHAQLATQQTEIRDTLVELRRANAAQMRGLHAESVRLVLDHPHLKEVFPHPEQEQEIFEKRLYANLLIRNIEMQFNEQVIGELQARRALEHFLTNPIIRDYWDSAQPFVEIDNGFWKLGNELFERQVGRRPSAQQS